MGQSQGNASAFSAYIATATFPGQILATGITAAIGNLEFAGVGFVLEVDVAGIDVIEAVHPDEQVKPFGNVFGPVIRQKSPACIGEVSPFVANGVDQRRLL